MRVRKVREVLCFLELYFAEAWKFSIHRKHGHPCLARNLLIEFGDECDDYQSKLERARVLWAMGETDAGIRCAQQLGDLHQAGEWLVEVSLETPKTIIDEYLQKAAAQAELSGNLIDQALCHR